MNKFVVILISAFFSSFIYGSQFIIVECFSTPNYYAYVSEPGTGKMLYNKTCGEALAHVPANFYLISSVGAGGKGGNGIKYLFSDTPVNG